MSSYSPSALVARAKGPGGKKLIKYTMVSAISVVVGQVLLIFAFGIMRWTAAWSNLFAVGLSAVPSYYLNRAWAWGKRGRSHFIKEVVPFWSLAFLGLAISTVAVRWVEPVAKDLTTDHGIRTAIISLTNLGAFGVLWVGKFIIFNRVLFKSHPQDLDPALDGRSGIPT